VENHVRGKHQLVFSAAVRRIGWIVVGLGVEGVIESKLGTQFEGIADPVGVAEVKFRLAGLEARALPSRVV
jgi:hypothetical protein